MKRRVLIVGSGRRCMGFGRVVTSLADRLGNEFDLHVLGYDVFDLSSPPVGWTLHTGKRSDVFGLTLLGPLCQRLRPELVLIVNDYWYLSAILDALGHWGERPRLVAYVPVDATLTDLAPISALSRLDQLVVYSNFARGTLLSACRESASVPPVLAGMRVIPHGSSAEVFASPSEATSLAACQPNRIEARSLLLGQRLKDLDGFWVLNANRNSVRKRIDLTMQGFARFARGKPDTVRLWLHCGGRNTGPNLRRVGRELGISDRLILSDELWPDGELSLKDMALLYKACDVGVNTSLGEGWGLVSFEHAAAGAAQIVPRHSALTELWAGAAEFIDCDGTFPLGRFLEGKTPSVEGLAAALQRFYEDPGHFEAACRAALRNAHKISLTWSAISELWADLFHDLLDERDRRAIA
jgi:glycosyltransferase involved in cell wall biosynthesis